MRYTYKVRELTPIPQEDHFEVGEAKQMEAMSLKKIQDIGPGEVNKYNMYIRFICTPENII